MTHYLSQMSDTALRTLADRLGILREYVDQTGRETRVTSDETRIAILAAMGIDASTEADAARALQQLEERERSRALRPVRVLAHGTSFSLPSSRATLTLEQGGTWRHGAELPLGYHTLALGDDTQTLIVGAPASRDARPPRDRHHREPLRRPKRRELGGW